MNFTHNLFKQINFAVITLDLRSATPKTPEYKFSSHFINFYNKYDQMSKLDKLKIAYSCVKQRHLQDG